MDRGAYFDKATGKYFIVDEGKVLRVSRTEMIDVLPDGVLDISKGAIPPGPADSPPDAPPETKQPKEEEEE